MKAVLVTVHWKEKRLNYQFLEGDDCIEQANGWRIAYGDDFPGTTWAIIPDEEASLAHDFVFQMTREA